MNVFLGSSGGGRSRSFVGVLLLDYKTFGLFAGWEIALGYLISSDLMLLSLLPRAQCLHWRQMADFKSPRKVCTSLNSATRTDLLSAR